MVGERWDVLHENVHFLLDINMLLLIITIIMIALIYLKKLSKVFTEITWIYSSLIPATTILFLNYNPKVYIELVYLILQGLFVFLHINSIKKQYRKLVNETITPLSNVKKVHNKNVGKEKSLEYIGLFILPFITVNSSVNILVIIVIIIIVIMIIRKFGLFYLNLPVLLFGSLQCVETNHSVKMIVLTHKDFIFEEGKSYDIRSFIENLNLYIYMPVNKK
ncbi:MAG: hypothetical protein Q4F01_09430 [Staphylococcus rostri]|uniref:hypothetical protein n=1 Tax=Staphylococcus rostri TaxID=522262 RepID=UPI0026DF4E59|nr:hypothetical protein [Staphylococcus rostri]MDO5376386.1 hypothetical protein [Staphylococcus rostri]